ncbi:uncharacterized protein JCM6883_000575 [Sporobolomyces salmoneus]|uniref:uncharacterized protein n=1 Tax=Sporobolomyces salmoneus TaxID=183962 RepID=UPI00317EA6FE
MPERYREDLAHIKARIQDAAQAAESSTTKEERDTAGEDLGRLKALRTRLEKEINDVKQQLEDDYPGFFENNNSSVATSPLGQTRSSAQPQQPLPSPAPQFLAEARNSSRNTQGGGGNVFETTHQVTREDLQHQVTLCKGQVERSTAILRLCRMPADVLMMLEGRLEEDSKQKLEAARKDLRRAKEELTKAQRALDAYDNPGESH